MATRTMDGHEMNDATGAYSSSHTHTKVGHYGRFVIMVGLSFLAMYIFMYSMVNSLPNVYNNINQVYMAGVMAAPMAIIEILVMRSMYKNKKLNAAILLVSIAAFAFFWNGIRNQIGVGDSQFVRSMIPHHSGAILMCNEAKIKDVELHDLCQSIIRDQQKEIDQMKQILSRLE